MLIWGGSDVPSVDLGLFGCPDVKFEVAQVPQGEFWGGAGALGVNFGYSSINFGTVQVPHC